MSRIRIRNRRRFGQVMDKTRSVYSTISFYLHSGDGMTNGQTRTAYLLRAPLPISSSGIKKSQPAWRQAGLSGVLLSTKIFIMQPNREGGLKAQMLQQSQKMGK